MSAERLMIIGKIDYINLLPFYIFLKRELKKSSEKAALNYYKGVPSHINHLFIKGKVEAAVVSSIISAKYRCSDFGIVANKKVLSVIICPGEDKKDSDSNTSNLLAQILGLQGEVLIGDKALCYPKKEECKDLANEWYKRYHLPFVFARFCYKKHSKQYEQLAKKFLQTPIKIPHYILQRYIKRSKLSRKEILHYLKLIHYKIGTREKRSLRLFLHLSNARL